ncbi:pseudouridine synthase, putative [Plasmodium gallinaceum]|uniref:Pseudouridine synthase, putative n=1 Tax=Plasmodium gallinaceum TaxID=5849 RepID=A0A1J1GTL9_PLAGA|nr:pseudouridine synthase, putative [Plasmodium gallinaceum]CRG94395.1 pseudouridine synthase, putative [Plasmodium gallinaceum]
MKFLYSILFYFNKLLCYFLIITSFKSNIFCFDLTITKNKSNEYIIRLNKLISIKKNISRRKSEKFIKDGNVKLNNKIITDPGRHVDITKDSLKICEKKIKIKNIKSLINEYKNNSYKWIVLHKPKGLICTSNDEKNRKSIFSIFPNDLLEKYRFVSVGRLDRNTSGVLLLTNEYEWVNRLTHPKYQRIRTYRIHIEGPVKMNVLKELASGIYLENDSSKKEKKKTQPAFIEIIREENLKIKDQIKKISVLSISVKEGRNRQIRKMFEQINQPIIKIKRTAFENITLKNIHFPKQYRELNQREVTNLKMRKF